ncbi:hypothetical protein [Cohnella terricola]|uniref:Uncharacterized protein n=1 Tax=Cohnella terricola TaxID=1289167 RepID=A0A559J8U7_9BACL|nr:hypothetical protein [Cohnella terricola]TVX96292.1 hypothetical protein FPZ45_21545 [Cohnella terricola]
MRSIKAIRSLFLIIICTFLISACSKNSQADVVDDGQVINSISIGLGGEPDNTLVTYNFNIWNKTRNTILIRSIEPVLSENLQQRLLDNEIKNEVNRTINGSTSEIFTGSFQLNTQGLDKQAIEKLKIRIEKFKIITEQELGLETH